MLGESGTNQVVASAASISASPFNATVVKPGSGAIDALYTLVSIDGTPVDTGAVNGSILLTSHGRFTAISQERWTGNSATFSNTGAYAIAGPRLLLNVEAGGGIGTRGQ